MHQRLFGAKSKKDEPAAPETESSGPPPPQAYNITGAGNARANGVYHLDQTQADSSVYRGTGAAEGLWMYVLRDTWTIALAEEDWYTAKSDGGPRPPPSGWVVEEDGVGPAPQVFAVAISSTSL